MLGKAIYARLSEDSGVAALVGTRVYPFEQPPQNRVYPLITYKIGGDEDDIQTYDGASQLTDDSVDVACIAESYSAAAELNEAIKAALNGQLGTWGGIVVKGAFKDPGEHDVQTPGDTDKKFFIIESSYTIWYMKG